jgi:hypothetical protein
MGVMVGRQRYRWDWPGMSDRTHRLMEKLGNLQVAIDIRDGPGGSPAADTVRLKACKRIEPKPVRSGLRQAAPVVGGLVAGYIIRLPADPPVIDGVVEPDEG